MTDDEFDFAQEYRTLGTAVTDALTAERSERRRSDLRVRAATIIAIVALFIDTVGLGFILVNVRTNQSTKTQVRDSNAILDCALLQGQKFPPASRTNPTANQRAVDFFNQCIRVNGVNFTTTIRIPKG